MEHNGALLQQIALRLCLYPLVHQILSAAVKFIDKKAFNNEGF